MINSIVILGIQWGDEGKGKIVDLLSENSNYVVRYQGGNNAGHTLLVNKKKTVLHLIPSCVLHKDVIAVLGNGVVVSLTDLVNEIVSLKKKGIFIQNRLILSSSIPLIFEYHIKLDKARECNLLNKSVIGTTHKGIGPAYEDKISRRAIRINDLYYSDYFYKILKKNVKYYNFTLKNLYQTKTVDFKKIFNKTMIAFKKVKHMIQDVSCLLNNKIDKNKKIIFEGAQGSLLDIDHGTYPYVSSSNSSIGGVITGTGVGIKKIKYILGVSKTYCTRVGNGPFPTEIFDDMSKYLCKKGKEFGTTTGRKRRIGWLDLFLLKKMILINSLSGLCLTKMDVLDFLPEIKICIKYLDKNSNQEISSYPMTIQSWKNIIPVYKIFKGWNKSTRGITSFAELPIEAQHYINYIQSFLNISIDLISTGPNRHETIIISKFLKKFIK
ncbi:adenylosuccinate synthase [Buchnera aphidicola]|uniref:adenylosuccinate synthase n=1 Tax=Buchnera aphidicola TaxID=9 RepID=UPI002237A5E8|nr:adenylosuccinate synthase [Buchnera aphidicola]MCW5197447.1 adenylosuccinate synthase [Buchnera aphidicola (Chaitophorus viminalis)]